MLSWADAQRAQSGKLLLGIWGGSAAAGAAIAVAQIAGTACLFNGTACAKALHAGGEVLMGDALGGASLAAPAAGTAMLAKTVADGIAVEAVESADDILASTIFRQGRKFWSEEPIEFAGNRVFQRNDLIDPNRIDSETGLSNLELMQNGFAPYGPDGKKINLHHMLQTQDGPIAEVTQAFHKENSKTIHINVGVRIPSGIVRSQLDKWKKKYWKERAKDFE